MDNERNHNSVKTQTELDQVVWRIDYDVNHWPRTQTKAKIYVKISKKQLNKQNSLPTAINKI